VLSYAGFTVSTRDRSNVDLPYIWGTREVHTGFWWGELRERDHLEGPGVGGRIILEWIFRKLNGEHGLD